MRLALLVVAVSLGAGTAVAQDCAGDPPSRVSDAYWAYLEACGCAKTSPVPRASNEYERYTKTCAAWRTRNPQLTVVLQAGASPSPGSVPSPSPGPGTVTTAAPSTPSAECRTGDVPSRTSSAFWTHIEACGCERTAAVPRASSDYDRYLKACSEWRQRNPGTTVIVPAASPRP